MAVEVPVVINPAFLTTDEETETASGFQVESKG